MQERKFINVLYVYLQCVHVLYVHVLYVYVLYVLVLYVLTLPPVVSASLPTSAKRQSVPSKLITDIMTLADEQKENIYDLLSLFIGF